MDHIRFPGKHFVVLLCLLLALLSAKVVGPYFSDPEHYEYFSESLDDKKKNVEAMAGSAVTASAVITLMPGDFGTPIADKMADLSTCFLVILCALYVEKMLISVSGVLVFELILPSGLILLALNEVIKVDIKRLATRIIALGLILVCLAPASILLSNMVEKQHNAEIQETINSVSTEVSNISGAADQAESDNSSVWSKFIKSVNGGSQALLERLQSALNSLLDLAAIYIVTSCIIPIVCFGVALWLIKLIFQVEIPVATRVIEEKKHNHPSRNGDDIRIRQIDKR